MEQKISRFGRRLLLYIRWMIVALILLTLFIGVIGFVIKWGEIIIHPEHFLANFRTIAEDIFSLVLIYEILDLIRTLSPNRLMDVLLTVLARKILLSTNEIHLAIDVAAFVVILIPRLILIFFSRRFEQQQTTS
ncbi:hypothetical protein LSG31_18235 [Fodinisporobacter ferrooxydans]|uniref:Transporter n=1 Tax=Fodinisporobacter ferrooxydans TaxID=2901836 RepID=A0ABY4CH04_9BACL|nr:hypothetical protein LSG31_18235 [Alicyclobacillaceae bacterium MYW30-H2]